MGKDIPLETLVDLNFTNGDLLRLSYTTDNLKSESLFKAKLPNNHTISLMRLNGYYINLAGEYVSRSNSNTTLL